MTVGLAACGSNSETSSSPSLALVAETSFVLTTLDPARTFEHRPVPGHRGREEGASRRRVRRGRRRHRRQGRSRTQYHIWRRRALS